MNIVHAFEQLQATLRDLSPVLWSYKENLKKVGFTDEQAFELTRDLQRTMILNSKNE